MTRIYLVRHAEAEGNYYRRLQGHYDSRVTVRGRAQLLALEKRFSGISLDAVYTSDLSRTRLTARAMTHGGAVPLVEDSRFREIDLGPWENVPFGWVELYQKDDLDRFSHQIEHWHIDGAEPYDSFTGRFLTALEEAARRHPNGTIAVATHGGVLRASLRRLFPGMEGGHADNTSVTALDYLNGSFDLIYANDASHLDESISTLAHQHWWRDPSQRALDENLWFRPVTTEEGQRYVEFREDAWKLIYGSLRDFNGPGFLSDAWQNADGEPQALAFAMRGPQIAGLIQLNMHRGQEQGAGYIPFIYLRPEFRGRGLGVQLLGHAVSVFRPLGRTSIQLSVAPNNRNAIRFYEKNGFTLLQKARGNKRYALHLMGLDIRLD